MEALNIEIKQLIDTDTLKAVDLADVPADATIINLTMMQKARQIQGTFVRLWERVKRPNC